jgi:tetratricopeptide (TPR) repeat protein
MEVFEKAISYYEKSLDLNPDNFESWNNLGTLYNHKNEFKKAEECYKEAMKWKEKSLI